MTYKLDKNLYIWQLSFAKITFQKVLKLNYKIFFMNFINQTNIYKIFSYIIKQIVLQNIIYYMIFVFILAKMIDYYY